jgi:hypothetical protein
VLGFIKKLLPGSGSRTKAIIEIKLGKTSQFFSKTFRHTLTKRPSERLSASTLTIPTSCLLLYKKEGYIINTYSFQKDASGTYLLIRCKIIVTENPHNPLSKDLRLLSSVGWTSES